MVSFPFESLGNQDANIYHNSCWTKLLGFLTVEASNDEDQMTAQWSQIKI